MRNKKTKIKILSYLTVGLLFTILTSTSNKIDSLKNVIETAVHDTTKIKALGQWDNLIYISDPKLDLKLNQRILQLCETNLNRNLTDTEKTFFTDKLVYSYNNIGIIYKQQSDYSLALDYYFKSLKILEELLERSPDKIGRYKQGMAYPYNNIGSIYSEQSDYPLALDYYFKALKIEEELGNKQGMASSYNNIGIIYENQSDYHLALDYYFKSIKIKQELHDTLDAHYANTYNNIGIIYENQSDYHLALDYYFKSLEIKEELGDKQGMAGSYTNIGNLYTSLYDQGDSIERAGGQVLKNSVHLDTALYYQQKALALQRELSADFDMIHSINGIGSIYVQKKDYPAALKHYQQSVLLADSIGALQQESEAHSGLAECYEKLGNHKLALEHYKQYSTLKDSVFNEEKSKDIGKLEASHEYEKQMLEQEKDHEKQQALAAAELKRQRIIGYSFIGGFVLVLILAFVIYRSFRQKKKANQLLEEKNEIIEEKNKDITDSIRYAQNIQEAILPNEEEIKKVLPDHFIYFQPRDIVSGDFYWFTKQNGKIHIAACDCTGHGVPGAFVSMIGNDLLNQIIIEKGLEKPGDILTQLNNGVKSVFTREGAEQQAQDGMDMALCVFDKDLKTLEFTGANNPLLLIQNGELKRIKGDKHAIGGDTEIDYNFTNHKINLQKGNTIYIFSDGYQDQFGGVRDKKFGTKRFREFLFSIQDKSMQEQKEILNKTIEDWKGDGEQIDDILIIGVRV